MEKWERRLGGLTRYGDYLARFGMVALMVLVAGNVILRYAWRSIQGTYDYVGLITAVSVSLAIAYTAYERGHIEIEVLMERLPERVQSIVGSAMMLLSTFFFCIASWQCVVVGNSMKAANETTMAVYVPIYPFMYILAFGLAMTALIVAMRCVGYIVKAVKR